MPKGHPELKLRSVEKALNSYGYERTTHSTGSHHKYRDREGNSVILRFVRGLGSGTISVNHVHPTAKALIAAGKIEKIGEFLARIREIGNPQGGRR